jgi:hypothetical protein
VGGIKIWRAISLDQIQQVGFGFHTQIAHLQQYDANPTVTRYGRQFPYGVQVVVFSWRSCPFCVKAKNLLTELGAEFEAFELDQSTPEGKAIRAELGQVLFQSLKTC